MLRIMLSIAVMHLAAVNALASPRLESAWDLFLDVCVRAVTNPQSVVSELSVPGPIGEKVFFETDDGRMTQIDTLISGIQINIEEFTLADRIHRDCSLGVTGDGSGNPELSVEAQLAVYEKRITSFTDLDIVGGRQIQAIPFGPQMNWIMPDQGNYLYVIHGLVPDTETLAYVTLGMDILNLHLTRSFPEEDDR